jgi:hypothetical protein
MYLISFQFFFHVADRDMLKKQKVYSMMKNNHEKHESGRDGLAQR